MDAAGVQALVVFQVAVGAGDEYDFLFVDFLHHEAQGAVVRQDFVAFFDQPMELGISGLVALQGESLVFPERDGLGEAAGSYFIAGQVQQDIRIFENLPYIEDVFAHLIEVAMGSVDAENIIMSLLDPEIVIVDDGGSQGDDYFLHASL